MRAALRNSGHPEAAARLGSLLGDDEVVGDYAGLLARCPPPEIGISPGAHAAVLGPLFGEFE